ncbi:phage tail fiber protein [Pseudonocardia acaciae]|uniref:phage tail fiber protein n=1 Tax=Pseudonocardia acaciae TaxID=551276 RepID=UPI00048C9AC2|nr:hypothetical protein [Pseudonocardia acaciae]
MPAHPSRERAIADSQFGGGATSWAPATWYLGLSVTAPNEDGSSFTQPTAGSYARVAVTNNATNFPPATTVDGITTKTNGAKFTFPNPTGTWGQIGWYGWFSAATGGTPEYSAALDAPVTVRSGNTPVEFDVNQLVMVFG